MALLTRYVNHAIVGGNDDGTTEADAWTYIYQATGDMKTDAGTNQYLVHVKASEIYGTDEDGGLNSLESDDADHDGAGGDPGAVLFCDQVGTQLLPNVFEGYFATPGDGGIVKIDCQGATNQLLNGIKTSGGGSAWIVFKNFNVVRAAGDGLSCSEDDDSYVTFKNCRSASSGGIGLVGNNSITTLCCLIEDSTSYGIDIDDSCRVLCCVSTNGTVGIRLKGGGIVYNSLAYNNSSNDYYSAGGGVTYLGITSDGEGAAGDNGIFQDAGAGHTSAVLNSIFHDCEHGIWSDSDSGENVISRHNVFNLSGTADVNNWLAASTGDGTGNRGDVVDPGGQLFENEGARDYTPHSTSGALGVAIDAYFTQQFWADYNNGAGDNPPAE